MHHHDPSAGRPPRPGTPRGGTHDDRLYARAPDALPALATVDGELLRRAAWLADVGNPDRRGRVLANPHHEPQVTRERRGHARSAAVLIAFQPMASGELALLLTERQAGLRFAGHLAFPGGHRDAGDVDAADTALRESEEEIGLARVNVDVLGTLPPYFSHAGHRIDGVLALVAAQAPLLPDPREVARLLHVPAQALFDPRAFRLHRRSAQPYRANYQWRGRGDGSAVASLVLGGPTLSLLIHVYDALARAAAR
jgi:8-oxo-dGTP pyrophosphatase MutT (NUDIX family)